MEKSTVRCDVLVIGGATAGCFAAITAKERGLDVLVLDKAGAGKAGASIMASGFWAVFNEDWGMDYDATLRWINANSSYLNNRSWTEAFLQDSWGTYLDLKRFGVRFPIAEEDMAGFFRQSIIGDDAAGHHDDDPHTHYGTIPLSHRAVTPALRRYAQSIGVRFSDRTMVTDLLVHCGVCRGAAGFSLDSGEALIVDAGAVILTAGRCYFRSPGMNVSGQTGDADALAYRAGAYISGKEFPDMHVNIARDPMWKGNGEMYPAYFQFDDAAGRRIPNKGFDLTMASVIHAGYGPVYWDFGKCTENDLRAIDEYLKKRGNPKEIERVGLDPHAGGRYPMIGGAAAGGGQEQATGLWSVDTTGRSTVPGLYAAGDCLASWMWGAIIQGPPPGLSPAAVAARRAAADAAEFVRGASRPALGADETGAAMAHLSSYGRRAAGFDPRYVTQLLQNYMMPYYILHIKEGGRLSATAELISFLRSHLIPKMRAEDAHMLRLAHETENMALNAEMMLRAALFRTESRGWHFREDFPRENDAEWLAWGRMHRGEGGEMVMDKVPVPDAWRPQGAPDYRERWLAWEKWDEPAEKEGV